MIYGQITLSLTIVFCSEEAWLDIFDHYNKEKHTIINYDYTVLGLKVGVQLPMDYCPLYTGVKKQSRNPKHGIYSKSRGLLALFHGSYFSISSTRSRI